MLGRKDPQPTARATEPEVTMNRDFAENKVAPLSGAAASAQNVPGTPCVLGPTLHFKGELYGEEDLEFQGQLEGSIEHTRSLSIGKEGGVKGNIRAKFVIIEGKVEGDVYATESVSIRQTAKVTGNIFAPRVGIADGAHFTGRIDMNHKGVAGKLDKPLSDTQAEHLLAAAGG
jgi:cytoskeletal protein CcmA (bactofilin family)